MKRITLFLLLVLLSICPIYGQEKASDNTYTLEQGHKSPTASLNQAAWLAGTWKGEGLGGLCEEVWTPPAASHMIGAFRMIKDDKNIFFEFLDIAEQEGSLVMHVKHFNQDLTGWEEKHEKVSFPLVLISENEINFDGLTYRKIDSQTMEVYLMINYESGAKEEAFRFNRAK